MGNLSSARAGLIARKLGMTCLFDGAGRRIPVTLLQVEGCQVLGQKTLEKNGYTALQVGAFSCDKFKLSKPLKVFFSELKGVETGKRKVCEFRVPEAHFLSAGTSLNVDHFHEGQFVDVVGCSIGKGFAGAMKRHNFRGLRASHGVSISHRSHGSVGNRSFPGRVFKGKKMAGHLGDARTTVLNLSVVRVDVESGILALKGAVPGAAGAYIVVRDAIKKPAVKVKEASDE
jgi:large subunit ribosomal protein L3